MHNTCSFHLIFESEIISCYCTMINVHRYVTNRKLLVIQKGLTLCYLTLWSGVSYRLYIVNLILFLLNVHLFEWQTFNDVLMYSLWYYIFMSLYKGCRLYTRKITHYKLLGYLHKFKVYIIDCFNSVWYFVLLQVQYECWMHYESINDIPQCSGCILCEKKLYFSPLRYLRKYE